MIIRNFGIIASLLFIQSLFAGNIKQSDSILGSINPLHIAIFIPFGLDKLYMPDALKHNYKIKDTNDVDYNEDAWNFYVGTKMAIDSLMNDKTERQPIVFHYYDVSNLESLQSLYNIMQNQNYRPDLLLGFVFGANFQHLANFARAEKIPFVSTIYPNITGQQDNEFLLVLNPTLRTHIRALLHSIREKNISIIMKSGEYPEVLHSIVQDVKQEIGAKKRVKYITLQDTSERSFHLNLGFANAYDQSFFLLTFDQDIIKKALLFFNNMANKDKIYHMIGLPLWEDFPFLQTFMPKYMQLTHSRGLYYNPNDSLVAKLKNNYEYYYFSPFNDMVGLGFESLYRFASLLQEYSDFRLWPEHIKDSTRLSLSNFELKHFQKEVDVQKEPDSSSAWTNEKIYFRIMKNRRSMYVEQNQ